MVLLNELKVGLCKDEDCGRYYWTVEDDENTLYDVYCGDKDEYCYECQQLYRLANKLNSDEDFNDMVTMVHIMTKTYY